MCELAQLEHEYDQGKAESCCPSDDQLDPGMLRPDCDQDRQQGELADREDGISSQLEIAAEEADAGVVQHQQLGAEDGKEDEDDDADCSGDAFADGR